MYTYPTDRDIAASRGLNLPEYERDACGIGFLCNVDGHPDHEIVRNGYRILVNLTHRGACGCDPETGDGCGMLMQLPHALFQREAEAMGFALPAPGAYGAGMVFLPQDAVSREACIARINRAVADEGQVLLGWRDVPRDNGVLGWLA
ncbi:MAG TPA: hypothetical protein PLC40_11060, partial [Candidatus Hydrogenedentes bacterium]|nr:hypothetical protein [Candidatus Hydrogenedentota bacterium]